MHITWSQYLDRLGIKVGLSTKGRIRAQKWGAIKAYLANKDSLPRQVYLTNRWFAVIHDVYKDGDLLVVDYTVHDEQQDELRFPHAAYPIKLDTPTVKVWQDPALTGRLGPAEWKEDVPAAFAQEVRNALASLVKKWE